VVLRESERGVLIDKGTESSTKRDRRELGDREMGTKRERQFY
jgi:hypothetical protein